MEDSTFTVKPSSSFDDFLENGTAPVANSSVITTGFTLSRSFQTLDLSVRLLEGFLAVITNSLTITAVAKFEFLRTNANLSIASLAIADLMGGLGPFIVLICFNAVNNPRIWIAFCLIEQFINMLSSSMNLFIITVISLDRAIYINFPLRYVSLIKRKHIVGVIALCWVYDIITVFVLLSFGITDDHGFVCHTRTIIVDEYKRFVGTWKTVGSWLLLSLIVLLNMNIGCVALKQYSKIRHEQNAVETVQTSRIKNENKITRVMLLVIGLLLASYSPQLTVLIVMANLSKIPPWLILFERVTAWIWWFNAWMNPFIYAWKSKEFNRAFRQLLGLKPKQEAAL